MKPEPDQDSAPFWSATVAGRLDLQRCQHCARIVFYPRARCPYCSEDALSWTTLSGRGMIYSFTVVNRRASAEADLDVPYVVALVDLAEGGRLMTNIVGCPVEEVAIGLPVQVTFKPVSDAVSLPLFAPAHQETP